MGLFSFTQEIAMDLGTANTIILNNGKIVVDEPSVVALDRRTDKMIAVGERAKMMYEKENPNIRTVRPLRDGVIADFNACEQMMRGGMTYTFAKAQGGKIGNSIVEDDKLDLALDIIAKAKAKGVNLVLGSDCVAADAFSNDAHTQVVPANNIPDGWEGLDAGPETQKAFAAAIEDAKTILWNGPAGVF